MIWSRLTSLRRVTSSGRYVPEIDGLRFVAIASVLLYHTTLLSLIETTQGPAAVSGLLAPLWRVVLHGDRGVLFFFAISGLVLGLPFAQQHLLGGKPVRLGAYLWRRVTRLEPPYVINLLLRFPFVLAAKHTTWRLAIPHLLASFLYLHGVLYRSYPLVHPPSWSLEIEVQFYLLAPALAFLVFHRQVWVRRGVLVVAILAFSVLRGQMGPWDHRLDFFIVGYLQYFLAGLLLADLYLLWMPRLKPNWVWDAISLPLWLASFWMSDAVAEYVLPWLCLVLFVAAFKGVLVNRFFRNGFVATTGGMCYSIYLTHSLVLQGSTREFARLTSASFGQTVALGMLVGIPLILAVGTVFYILIERPCMDRDWPRRLGKWLEGMLRRRQPEPSVERVH